MLVPEQELGSGVSVASITTAYNAIRILPRHIEALMRQTRPLQEIVIVDNGSTDGSAAMLAERYPQVTVLPMARNLGAAGGWAEGLRYAALEKGHDWVWTFDDDSVPGANALEELLAGFALIRPGLELGMMVPLPVNESTGMPYPPLLWDEGFVKPSAELLQRPLWFADLAITSGSLVRSEAARRVGLPRPEFFMDFFDFEYCLRMRSQGFLIAVVRNCHFAHSIGDARKVRMLGRDYILANYAPWREYYRARNIIYSMWHLYPTSKTKRFAISRVLRQMFWAALFNQDRFKSVYRMLQGVSDGIRGKLGIRFLPGGAPVIKWR
ncbi:MAG TPA: glycosyltransferase [Acidobacteriaceae bacterium]|jgi:GT2 family glycosyltransferase|nr:glycosyltransferase [Acidobacteriaceae bacterium]